MTIEKVRCNGFSEINLDAFNRQQEITRIYVRKDEKYVLEEQPGMMDWSIDKKREVALDLVDSRLQGVAHVHLAVGHDAKLFGGEECGCGIVETLRVNRFALSKCVDAECKAEQREE